MIPDALGDFAIEHELGRGGSGVVYAARHAGRDVALKVLKADEAATPKERQRFLSEARHLARVEHPGVVRVVAVGELPDGRPYLAMERLRGGTLAERVIMGGRMTVEQALVLFEQLAAAVGALHASGLVHRDIKPENIFLEGDRLVLLDLGIAREVGDLPSTTTQAGLQRGTPAYMAPERFFGARATVASDVYECAVVLYVMLTGGLPWDPTSPKDRMAPKAPSERGVALPPGLERALMAALGVDPVHRPASIEELVASVRSAGWAGETRAVPVATQTERTSRARSVLVGVGLVAGFATAVVVAFAATRTTRSEVKAEPREAPRPEPEIIALETLPPDAAPPPSVDAAPPKKPPKPKKQRSGTGTGTATGTGAQGACAKIAQLYCTDEFKATEGTLAGQLCTSMTKTAASMDEAWCAEHHDQMAAAVAERLRQFEEGIGPPSTR